MTPAELLPAAAEQKGMHHGILEKMLRNAGWHPEILASEFQLEGWFERLQGVLMTRYADGSVSDIGPSGARELTDAQCLELITPKLRNAVGAYEGGPALMLGRTGAGKTLAARLMARKVGRRWAGESIAKQKHRLEHSDIYTVERLGIAWYSATELALAVARHPLGKGAPEEVDKARDGSLLVLDDLTWPQRDDTTLEVLGHRYDNGKPTIATAGCSRADLIARFGDAVVRRLLECRGKKGMLVEE